MLLEGYRRWLTVAAIGGSGAMAGLFLSFSTFTMSGIRRLPAVQGLQAMQSINRSAERSPLLLLGLFGTGAVCVVLGVAAARDLDAPASVLQLVASGLYAVGVVGMTVAFHVPRNDALAALDPGSPGALEAWRDYARTWTAGNHVRTLAPLAATVLYTLSLRAR